MSSANALRFARATEDQRLSALVVAAQRYNAGTLDAAELAGVHRHTLEGLSRERVCATCSAKYTWAAELGRRSCRMHSGMWDNPSGAWTCCASRNVRAQPCHARDHADTQHASAAFVVVPRCFAETVLRAIPPGSVVPAAAAAPERSCTVIDQADVPDQSVADLYWREMRRGALVVSCAGAVQTGGRAP